MNSIGLRECKESKQNFMTLKVKMTYNIIKGKKILDCIIKISTFKQNELKAGNVERYYSILVHTQRVQCSQSSRTGFTMPPTLLLTRICAELHKQPKTFGLTQ